MLKTYTEDMFPAGMEDKQKVHELGLWHKVVSGLVMNKTHMFLQTIYPKESYGFTRPDFLDISVGGHVEDNENERAALLREAREELGLNDLQQIQFVCVRKVSCDPSPTYKIREFQYLYKIDVTKTLKDFDLRKTEPEVKSIVAIDRQDLLRLLTKKISGFWAQEAVFDKKTRQLVTIQDRHITLSDFIPDYLECRLFEQILK